MKAITGVDLKNVLSQAKDKLLEVKTAEVIEKVKTLLGQIETATLAVDSAKKNLEGKERELTKLTEKLARVEKGEWDAIEDKNQGGGKPSNE